MASLSVPISLGRVMTLGERRDLIEVAIDMLQSRFIGPYIVALGPRYKDSRCTLPEEPTSVIVERRPNFRLNRSLVTLRPQKVFANSFFSNADKVIWNPSMLTWLDNSSGDEPVLLTLFFAPHPMTLDLIKGSGAPFTPRSYTIAELLALRRELPCLVFDLDKINKEVTSDVLPAILNRSLGINKNIYMGRHTLPMASNSSTDDDEDHVVYRGHPARRLVRQVAWHLRRRDASNFSDQPLSAPPGTAAQKADNFKKFYRAVVSPTHVRVTAGGRIVPNTRAPPQPVFSRASDTDTVEENILSGKQGDRLDQGDFQDGVRIDREVSHFLEDRTHTPGSNCSDLVTVNRARAAEMESGIFMSHLQSHGLNEDLTETVNRQNAAETKDFCNDGDIKISPPSQFDTTRPFLFNGQMICPLPFGVQPPILPYSMLGNAALGQPGIVPQLASGMFPPQAMPFPAPNITAQLPIVHPPSMTGFQSFPGLTPLMMPNIPIQPIAGMMRQGSYLGSPITVPVASQVDQHLQSLISLQQQIKHLNNQLENNKHQIDEQHVLAQRDLIQAQLVALQTSLGGMAIQAESRSLPFGSSSNKAKIRVASTFGAYSVGGAEKKTEASYSSPAKHMNSHKHFAIDPSESHSKQSQSASKASFQSSANPYDIATPVRSEKGSRKRLSAAAAMAPPFLPRSMQFTGSESQARFNDGSKSAVTKGATVLPNPFSHYSPEGEPVSKGKTNSLKPAFGLRGFNSTVPSLPKAQTMHNTLRSDSFAPSPLTLKPFQSQSFPSGTHSEPMLRDVPSSHSGMPYLMGFPPPGSGLDSTSPRDFIYSRKLTEEEQRARYLYWGKAPPAVTKGLPKFDGRDFYPASPVKTSTVPEIKSDSTDNQKQNFKGQSTDQSWASRPGYEGYIVSSEPSKLNTPTKYAPDGELRRKASWEIAFEAGSGDDVSVDSWEVTKREKKAIYAASLSQSSVNRGPSQSFTMEIERSMDEKIEFDDGNQTPRGSVNSSTQPSFLQHMLKHSPREMMTATFKTAQSSNTARGYLGQYRGSAATALAPSTSTVNASTQGYGNYNPTQAGQTDPSVPRRAENQPPVSTFSSPTGDVLSATDMLRRVTEKEHVDKGFNPNTTGIGPIYSSDW